MPGAEDFFFLSSVTEVMPGCSYSSLSLSNPGAPKC
jgi:hypothetical protein